MFPILSGYIAMSIAERPALMPGIVGGLLAKAGTSVFVAEADWIPSGFFGALFAGFIAGYLMLLIKKVFAKLPRALEGTKPVLIYPFFGIVLIGAIMVFIINPPVGAFNQWLYDGLASMGEGSKLLLGAVLGGMTVSYTHLIRRIQSKNQMTEKITIAKTRVKVMVTIVKIRVQERIKRKTL